MASNLRIMIAEDHETVREGIKLIVEAQEDMVVVGEAGNGRAAVKLSLELQPDIVLMDISIPDLNGLKASAKLKRVAPDIKILILTRHTDAAYLHELLQAGISGYVLKQSASAELIRAVHAVAGGNSYLDPAVTDKVFAGYAGKPDERSGKTTGKRLTARESEVLRHIALGYSNKEIAEKMNISVKTAEAHKANCLKKLCIKSCKEIISYAILQGWMQEN